MNLRIKNTTVWLLIAAMLLLLAGCGERSNLKVVDDQHDQPEYLSFFATNDLSDSDAAKYWSDRFTEEYSKNVYINFDGATYYAEEGLSYRELLEKRLESSAPDDMYIINAEDVLEFEKKGFWLDLSKMDFVANLSEAALYQSSYNGKVFSLPLSFTGFGFVWNLDMLAEHGLTLPQNQAEFWTVCAQLKEADVTPYGGNKGYALTVPAMSVGLAELYSTPDQEQRIADLNSGETPISTYLRPGFEFLKQMIDKGYLDPKQAYSTAPKSETDLFAAGGCAFICIKLGDTLDVPFQVALTGLPVLPDGSIAVYGADMRLCVNPNSEHLATVQEFIEMVGTPEALNQTAVISHAMSTAKNGETGEFPTAQTLVELLQQPGQVPNQDFSLHFSTWESIRDVCRELCLSADIDEACNLLDAKQRADLAAYN